MIRLEDLPLPAEAQNGLDQLQQQVSGFVDYAQQVEAAKKLFPQHNKPKNKVFKEIRATLAKMCSGARRCAYCEDSAADEVEHIKPKDLYPEFVFVWGNYVYACGPCNGPKNNQFKVFKGSKAVEVTRKKNDPVKPPIKGALVLIDPRVEDPLHFIELDLLGTFFFLPTGKKGTKAHSRGQYTIELLRLNERDFLCEARGDAYESFIGLLERYIRRRDGGATAAQLDKIIRALKRQPHQSVWQEMKRKHQQIPDLNNLFSQAPEALQW